MHDTSSAATRNHIFDLVFIVGLTIKGLDGLSELLFGFVLFFLPKGQITSLAHSLTVHELTEDPHDLIANLILHGVAHLSSGAALFLGVYLLVHGLVKVVIVGALIVGAHRIYPWAIGLLSALTVFQAVEFVLHPTLGVFLLTLLDIIVIVLTWREWRQNRLLKETFITTVAWLKSMRKAHKAAE